MGVEEFPLDKANDSLIARIKPLPESVQPSDQFLLWSRRMLFNFMAASQQDDAIPQREETETDDRARGVA